MAMEWNYDDFEVGCVLSVETLFEEEFKGRVVTFDRSTNILVLQDLESGETRDINTVHLQKCTRVGRSEDPLRESVLEKTVFLAQLQSGSPFLQSLISMGEISSYAVLIVREGEIELQNFSRDAASHTSLVLQAETVLPSPTGCFAFQFNLSALTRSLLKFFEDMHAKSGHHALLKGKTLWIYKMSDVDDLCFLIGLNPHPLRFKPECELQLQTDLRNLHLLPVKVTLTAEWFRKLLKLFDVEQSVSVQLMDNFLIWKSGEKLLRLDDPTKYSVQGSRGGKPKRFEVKFIHRKALFLASYLSETAVVSLVGKKAMGKCILFQFPIDRSSHFSVGRSFDANTIQQKKISAKKDAK